MIEVVLCSKHEKAKVIAPYLSKLGFTLQETKDFDTDTLGTFSGEIERTLTPLEAALRKAKEACQLSGADYGMGSEGSFGGGPMPGIVNWNEEILCFYQASTERTIFAKAANATHVQNLDADSYDDLRLALKEHPGQHWILREDQQLLKGLSEDDLLKLHSEDKLLFPLTLEPDLRAMHCPERQTIIAKAAEDLVERLQALCPQCEAPDFVIKEAKDGLACGLCSLPTKQIKEYVKICSECEFREVIPSEKSQGDPTFCDYCNP